MKLNEPLESAIQRVGLTGAAISEMNLMWALELGDPRLTAVLRNSGLNYQSVMNEYYGIRDSKIQVHRVRALTAPTEYVLRTKTAVRGGE